MKLLLDQGLPRSAASLLREAGIDAVHVGEIGYSTADDASILEKCREEGRIVVTLDAVPHSTCTLRGYIPFGDSYPDGRNARGGNGKSDSVCDH